MRNEIGQGTLAFPAAKGSDELPRRGNPRS